VVTATLPAPDDPKPTAKQSLLVTQIAPRRMAIPLGRFWGVQLVPPSVVATSALTPNCFAPAAQQSALVGQDTADRPVITLGRF
jgi:hypothetical protein